MAILHLFRCLHPKYEKAAQVAAVPYDVVNRLEAKQMAKGNPLSFLHVSRAEIDLPDEEPAHSEVVYRKAAENFGKLIRECPFILESKPLLYIYRLKMKEHAQTGIVGTFSMDEYDSEVIKKHERTRQEKEDDRIRHMKEIAAQTGPAYLAYRDVNEIDQAVEKETASAPLYQFTASDGVIHSVWAVNSPERFVELFQNRVSSLYIADGHHRVAAASRVRAELKKTDPQWTREVSCNFFLAVAFPASQLKILSYHRIVKDLGLHTDLDFINLLNKKFKVTPGDRSLPKAGQFGMYLSGKWYNLQPALEESRLDVDLLHHLVLRPILGIGDVRTDSRIDFVGGIRGTEELERLVQCGEARVAFAMHPTQLKQVMDVSDRSEIMPPKSTWFEPKLKDGLFCHVFNPERIL